MYTLGLLVMVLGWLMIASGLLVDFVAALAMTSFPLR